MHDAAQLCDGLLSFCSTACCLAQATMRNDSYLSKSLALFSWMKCRRSPATPFTWAYIARALENKREDNRCAFIRMQEYRLPKGWTAETAQIMSEGAHDRAYE